MNNLQSNQLTKAYLINTINLDKNNESVYMGYLTSNVIYAQNERGARKKAYSLIIEYDVKDQYGEDLSYVSVKVTRAKSLDKVTDGSGNFKTIEEIKYEYRVKAYKKDLDLLLEKNPGAFAYIMKGGYFYRPNSKGYTEFQQFAGVYTIDEAVSACKSCDIKDGMQPIIINKENHNEKINKSIADLQSRLIGEELKVDNWIKFTGQEVKPGDYWVVIDDKEDPVQQAQVNSKELARLTGQHGFWQYFDTALDRQVFPTHYLPIVVPSPPKS